MPGRYSDDHEPIIEGVDRPYIAAHPLYRMMCIEVNAAGCSLHMDEHSVELAYWDRDRHGVPTRHLLGWWPLASATVEEIRAAIAGAKREGVAA